MKANTMGHYYEDFAVGEEVLHSKSKTIYESDNNLFCMLTMNHHPVHINEDYAQKNQHGKALVVGTLVFSLAVGLTVDDISGKAIANLDYEEIIHKAPVFVGDTISAKTIILDKRLSVSKPDRGIVYVETIVTNQKKEVVLTFKRHILIKTKASEKETE